jgi:hypothetical protein
MSGAAFAAVAAILLLGLMAFASEISRNTSLPPPASGGSIVAISG